MLDRLERRSTLTGLCPAAEVREIQGGCASFPRVIVMMGNNVCSNGSSQHNIASVQINPAFTSNSTPAVALFPSAGTVLKITQSQVVAGELIVAIEDADLPKEAGYIENDESDLTIKS